MNHTRSTLAFILVAFWLAPGMAQEGRVIVVQPGAKELKRTAQRLRIPVERLKNARAALQEATDLARKLDTVSPNLFPQLGEAWIQLYRDQASSTIDTLYAALRSAAAKASDLQAYQQGTYAAQSLLTSFAELDSEKALRMLRQWPDPPASLGEEGARLRNQLEPQYQNQTAQRMVYRDPKEAMKLLPPLTPSGAPDYSIRGQVALQLAREGNKEEAMKIADQVIADFQQRAADPRNAQEYAAFLQNLAQLDPDRFSDAFNMLASAVAKQPPIGSYPTSIQLGDQTAVLTPQESFMLNIFRSIQGRPQLASKTLDGLPDLKAKLDQIGGIDNFLNPSAAAGPITYNYNSPAGGNLRNSPAPPGKGKDTVSSLYTELRGKARKDPGLVRTRLTEVASIPTQIDLLIGLAQRSNYEDPELASMALEIAVASLPRLEPVQRRAATFQNLLNTYRQCEGEADPELLRNGFIIADSLRQEEEKANPDNLNRKMGFGSPADQLEATLISEFARDNFDAAMRFLRAKPDDSIKLMTMLRVIQALRSSY